jgi:hypothetical protein
MGLRTSFNPMGLTKKTTIPPILPDWQLITTIDYDGTLVDITYGNGKFVAVATNSQHAIYSSNGINWNKSTLFEYSYWDSIGFGIYDNKPIFLVAGSRETINFTFNLSSWMPSMMPNDEYWTTPTYGSGKWLIGGTDNMAYSSTLDNWSMMTKPMNNACYTYGNGKFVSLNNLQNKYSTNGTTWKTNTHPLNAYWDAVTYGNNRFVAVGWTSKTMYSIDGITWYQGGNITANLHWDSVVYGNGIFLAMASSKNQTSYSTDGITWYEGPTLPNGPSWRKIAYGSGAFVVISNESKVAYLPFPQ